MASIKSFIFIKSIILWNKMTEYYKNIKNRFTDFYNYIHYYFKGDNHKWVIIPGHTLPISLNNIYNEVDSEWLYNNLSNTLFYMQKSEEDYKLFKFSWLSAKIVLILHGEQDKSYDIDNFLNNFKLYTVKDKIPDLFTIFMIWCIHTKHWFKKNTYVEFHIIDDNGDERILYAENTELKIENNKIYDIVKNKN